MRKSHVESRSRKYAAVQNVADRDDWKPEVCDKPPIVGPKKATSEIPEASAIPLPLKSD